MTRAEIMRRLHEMVDQLATVPESWFEEGIYPLHKATFARKDGGDERITLIVGVADHDE